MAEIKKLAGSQVEIKVSIAWNDWKEYIDGAVKDVSEEIKIPGFRPGKAPKNLVEQRVGIGTILSAAAEKAVQKSYTDVVVKEKLEVIGRPEVTIDELKEEADIVYTAKVAIMPEAELSHKYKDKVKKINAEYAAKSAQVSDEDLQVELEKLAQSRVKLVTVAREARSNDSVEVDFSVLVGGVPIENGSSSKHPIIIGRGVFIPGFEEQIIGMREGDEKEFELKFPEDYHKKDLAGKPATFKVKMGIVQERQTPEISDDFARSLGKFEDLSALKKNMREGLEQENKHKLEESRKNESIEAIISETKADLPEVLVRQELHQMLHEFEYQIQSMGMNLDDYLKNLKKSRADLEKDWEPQAKKRVLSGLAMKEIFKQEEMSVDSSEIEAEMNKTLQYYKGVKNMEQNIDMERLYAYTKGNLENEKVFGFLKKL